MRATRRPPSFDRRRPAPPPLLLLSEVGHVKGVGPDQLRRFGVTDPTWTSSTQMPACGSRGWPGLLRFVRSKRLAVGLGVVAPVTKPKSVPRLAVAFSGTCAAGSSGVMDAVLARGQAGARVEASVHAGACSAPRSAWSSSCRSVARWSASRAWRTSSSIARWAPAARSRAARPVSVM